MWRTQFLSSFPVPTSDFRFPTFAKYPARESNPVFQFRGLPCRPSHSQGVSSPSRNRIWSDSFGRCHAVHHTHGLHFQRSIPTWSRTRTKTLGGSCAIRYTIGMWVKSRRLELHQHHPVYKTGA